MGAATTCSLADGDFVTFDGLSVDRWNSDGSLELHLWTAPAFVYASFVEVTPGGTAVVVGDSGNGSTVSGDLHLVQLDGSGATWIASVPYNYDGAFLPSGELIVSAAQGGFGTGNDLVRVSLAPPSAVVIGHVDGPSGPVAVTRTGDVLYATQASGFPPPVGSTDVVKWSASQLAAGAFLDDANAIVLGTGFDPIGSLAVDGLKGRIYAAENNFTTGSYRVLRVKSTGASSIALAVSDTWISGLRFRSLGGNATFDAYQPDDGLSLVYETTDFWTLNDLVTIAPARPVLSVSGPGVSGVGTVSLAISGGVPNGSALMSYCPQTAILPAEASYPLPKFLHHTPFVLSQTTRFEFLIPLDATGAGQLDLYNPGGLSGLYGWQTLVGNAAGVLIGSTNPVQF
jgi:hypothetical protein